MTIPPGISAHVEAPPTLPLGPGHAIRFGQWDMSKQEIYTCLLTGAFSLGIAPLRMNATLRLPSYQEGQAMERHLEATAENPS